MKKYKVTLYYSESGYSIVEANSKEEAEKFIYKELETNGLEGIKKMYNFDIYNRDYDTTGSEELK